MDITLLIGIAIGIITLIIFVTIFSRKKTDKNDNQNVGVPRGQPVRRAAGVRNARRRMQIRENIDDEELDNNSDNENDVNDKIELPDGKLGAKKRAKLEAKAEKKQQREALEKEREEKKKKDKLLQEEADKLREKEKADELKKEEDERKLREEKEKRDYEEYLKMKEAFSVEEEGFDEEIQDEKNLLNEFLEYIKYNKVVVLEDLAGHFHIKTTSVIERINSLQADGYLTGVIDDRGKFIYISQNELEAVAKFVKQRGRVSISELAESSNQLINLIPGQPKNIVEAN